MGQSSRSSRKRRDKEPRRSRRSHHHSSKTTSHERKARKFATDDTTEPESDPERPETWSTHETITLTFPLRRAEKYSADSEDIPEKFLFRFRSDHFNEDDDVDYQTSVVMGWVRKQLRIDRPVLMDRKIRDEVLKQTRECVQKQFEWGKDGGDDGGGDSSVDELPTILEDTRLDDEGEAEDGVSEEKSDSIESKEDLGKGRNDSFQGEDDPNQGDVKSLQGKEDLGQGEDHSFRREGRSSQGEDDSFHSEEYSNQGEYIWRHGEEYLYDSKTRHNIHSTEMVPGFEDDYEFSAGFEDEAGPSRAMGVPSENGWEQDWKSE